MSHQEPSASWHELPCRLWNGPRMNRGYGHRAAGRLSSRMVHRQVIEQAGEDQFGTPWDRKLMVSHLCENLSCFRYEHLKLITRRENSLKEVRAGWEITIPGEVWTVNGERKLNRYRRAELVRALRERACIEARVAGLPRLDRCDVSVRPIQRADRGGPLADVAGHAPAVKAVIDGLVDAGLLPDDGPDHLLSVRFYPPVKAGKVGGIQVIVHAAE